MVDDKWSIGVKVKPDDATLWSVRLTQEQQERADTAAVTGHKLKTKLVY